MVGTLRCGPPQAIINQPRQNVVTVQSGKLIANAGGSSYIQTSGKLYEIIATNASVKKDLKAAGNDATFANVKGKLEIMSDGREVIKATSITGEKPMTAVDGDSGVSFPRCGNVAMFNDGTKTIKLEPMTEEAISDFQRARSFAKFPAGTRLVGVMKGDTLQVWDVVKRMRTQPVPPPRTADSFVSVDL